MDISEIKNGMLEVVDEAVKAITAVLGSSKVDKLKEGVKESLQLLLDSADEARKLINDGDFDNDKQFDAINEIVGKYEDALDKCNEFMDKYNKSFIDIPALLKEFDAAVEELNKIAASDKFKNLKEKDKLEVKELLGEASTARSIIESTKTNDDNEIARANKTVKEYTDAADKYGKKLSSRKVTKVKTEKEKSEKEKSDTKKARKKASKIVVFALLVALVAGLVGFLLRGCGQETNTPINTEPRKPGYETTLTPEEEDYLRGIPDFDINSYDLTDYSQRRAAAQVIYDNLDEELRDELSIRGVGEALLLANIDRLPDDKQGTFFTSAEHLAEATYVQGQIVADPNVNSNNVVKGEHLTLSESELQRVIDYATNGKLTLNDFSPCKTDKGFDFNLVSELCEAKMKSTDRPAEWAKTFIELDVESTMEYTIPASADETRYEHFYFETGLANQAKDTIVKVLNDDQMTAIYGSNKAAQICPTEVFRQQQITNKFGTYSTPGQIDIYIDENGAEWPKSYVQFDSNGNAYVEVAIEVDENNIPIKTAKRSCTFLKTVLSNQYLDANSDYVDALCSPTNSGFTR